MPRNIFYGLMLAKLCGGGVGSGVSGTLKKEAAELHPQFCLTNSWFT